MGLLRGGLGKSYFQGCDKFVRKRAAKKMSIRKNIPVFGRKRKTDVAVCLRGGQVWFMCETGGGKLPYHRRTPSRSHAELNPNQAQHENTVSCQRHYCHGPLKWHLSGLIHTPLFWLIRPLLRFDVGQSYDDSFMRSPNSMYQLE